MCSYNRVNGDFACENKYLLTDVLRKDWNFKGFVVSDWGGTHSTVKASAAGLDNEEPWDDFLWRAHEEGRAVRPEFRWPNSMSMCAAFYAPYSSPALWIIPRKGASLMLTGGFDIAQKIAEQSIVLLKNDTCSASAGNFQASQHRHHRCACGRGHDLRRRFRAG